MANVWTGSGLRRPVSSCSDLLWRPPTNRPRGIYFFARFNIKVTLAHANAHKSISLFQFEFFHSFAISSHHVIACFKTCTSWPSLCSAWPVPARVGAEHTHRPRMTIMVIASIEAHKRALLLASGFKATLRRDGQCLCGSADL